MREKFVKEILWESRNKYYCIVEAPIPEWVQRSETRKELSKVKKLRGHASLVIRRKAVTSGFAKVRRYDVIKGNPAKWGEYSL